MKALSASASRRIAPEEMGSDMGAASPAIAISASVSYTTSRAGASHRRRGGGSCRSEEHTSELQSLMRISYAVFCFKKKKKSSKQNSLNLIYISITVSQRQLNF